jgi:hypothetical protein
VEQTWAGNGLLVGTGNWYKPRSVRVRRQGLEPRTRGLRVRCSAYPHVHRRTPVQVPVVHVPLWTVLDLGELQLKLQLDVGEECGPSGIALTARDGARSGSR